MINDKDFKIIDLVIYLLRFFVSKYYTMASFGYNKQNFQQAINAMYSGKDFQQKVLEMKIIGCLGLSQIEKHEDNYKLKLSPPNN